MVRRLQKRWEAGLDVGQALRAARVDADACRFAIRHGLDDAADMLIGRSAARQPNPQSKTLAAASKASVSPNLAK